MRIVNIIGGLGNQMFQYAFALSLQKRFPDERILIDISHFQGYRLHQGFQIPDIFPHAQLPIASAREIRKVTYYVPHYKLSRVVRRLLPTGGNEYLEKRGYTFDDNVFVQEKDCYYEGYWQSWQFFNDIKEEVQYSFEFKDTNEYNKHIVSDIRLNEAVGIHIRRGDYLTDAEYTGVCELDYYKRAIEKIGTHDKTFFLFSNDMAWCKENIIPLLGNARSVFVDGNTGAESFWDIYLMTRCDHLIIANSSFSWWAAYLNKSVRTVVAPKKWINRDYEADVYLPEWVRL